MDSLQYYNLLQNQYNWDIFIKVIFPFITLLLGAFISYGVQLISEIRRISLIRKYLINSLIDLNKAIDSQIIHYSNFIKQISENNEDLPLLILEPGFHILNFESISRYDIFKSIVLKGFFKKEQKREALIGFNNSLEIIKVIEEQSKDGIDSLKKSEYNDKKNFNAHFYKLQELLNHKIKNYNEIKTKNEKIISPSNDIDEHAINKEIYFIENIIKINLDFINTTPPKKTIYHYEDKFIKPIFEIVKGYGDIDLISLFPPIFSVMDKIRSTRSQFISTLEMYKIQLLIAKVKFDKVRDLLIE